MRFPIKSLAEILWIFLQELTDEEFNKAINELISTQKELYPGTNLIALIREKAKTTLSLTAGEAWGIVYNEILKTGNYGTPEISDPIIAKAVSIIGWRELCLSEQISIERAHFMKIYDMLVQREQQEKMLLPFKKTKLLESGD